MSTPGCVWRETRTISWPFSWSSVATAVPIKPVAPITTTFMAYFFLRCTHALGRVALPARRAGCSRQCTGARSSLRSWALPRRQLWHPQASAHPANRLSATFVGVAGRPGGASPTSGPKKVPGTATPVATVSPPVGRPHEPAGLPGRPHQLLRCYLRDPTDETVPVEVNVPVAAVPALFSCVLP